MRWELEQPGQAGTPARKGLWRRGDFRRVLSLLVVAIFVVGVVPQRIFAQVGIGDAYEKGRTETDYDSKGRVVTQTAYDKNGNEREKTENTYDENYMTKSRKTKTHADGSKAIDETFYTPGASFPEYKTYEELDKNGTPIRRWRLKWSQGHKTWIIDARWDYKRKTWIEDDQPAGGKDSGGEKDGGGGGKSR